MRLSLILKGLFLFFLFLFFIFLYKIYIPRIAAFGCFDDCFNYGAGFFLTKGKQLYSEIFFNHQPFPAYISAVIQTVTKPANIYALLLSHRQFVLLFAFLWEALLIIRFGYVGLEFSLLYEITKFYLFGDRFLAEGIIVYPLVYMTAIVWNQLQRKKIYQVDFVLSLLSAWFVFFMREPFIPVVLFLFGVISFLHAKRKQRILLPATLIVLIGITIAAFPIREYFFNVVTVNIQSVLLESIQESKFLGPGMFISFFYPIVIFFGGTWNLFLQILLFIDFLFLSCIFYLFRKKQFRKAAILGMIILGLANLRTVPVGQIYYASFHLLPWYAIFLFTTILMIQTIHSFNRIISHLLSLGFFAIIVFVLFSPQIFFREKIDPHTEFITNYGTELQIGNVARALITPTQTLFLDGWAELIYIQSDRISPYAYTWYTSVMPRFRQYSDARAQMFSTNPPDLYYGTCPKEQNVQRMMPPEILSQYQQLKEDGKPSCLWIKKSNISQITTRQWQKAKEQLFEL